MVKGLVVRIQVYFQEKDSKYTYQGQIQLSTTYVAGYSENNLNYVVRILIWPNWTYRIFPHSLDLIVFNCQSGGIEGVIYCGRVQSSKNQWSDVIKRIYLVKY